jgi:enamine deaminase RidA (YjgF/YER057c/UK114 family)
MAEPIVRTFEIDTAKSEQNLRQLGSALDSADNSGKSLRAQLRELNQQLANTDPQTQKYRDLSVAAGELKDRMQDAAQAVGTQAGGAFEKVSGSIGLVTSRLVSLDFQGAAEGAKLFAQNAGSIKLKDVSEGVKGLTSTLGTLGKALLTNPIFLLGSVIVGIIANFDALKSSGGALGDFFTGISDSVSFLKDSLLSLSDAIGLTNTKAAEQAEKIKQQNKEALDNIKEYANTVGSDVEKKSQEILQASGGNLKQAREKFKEYSDQVKVLNENLINEFNLIVERGGKLDEYQQQRLDAAIKENAAFEKVLTDINKSITETDQKAQDDAQKREEDRLRRLEAAGQRLLAIRRQVFEESQKLTAQIQGDQAQPDSAKSGISDLDAELEAQRSAQEFSISLMQEGVDKEIAMADAKYAAMRDAAKGNAEQLAIIAQMNADEVAQIEKNAQMQKLDFAKQTLNGIAQITSAFGKNNEKTAKAAFKVQKAISIAQATISTYESANSIFNSTAKNPITVAFPGAPFVAAGVAVAAGLANVATIASQQFQGSTSGGNNGGNTPPSFSGGGGGNESQPATFNPFASQFITNRPDQYLPRAYVLAGDVSSQQEVRENVEDLARIG